MNYFQMINTAATLISAKVTGRRIPFQVHIGVTRQCNRSCSYCEDFYSGPSRTSPTTSQFYDLIDSCARLGTKRITLLGGEPLLRQDIDGIVGRINYHGISCSLTTNGHFSEQHLKTLKKLDQLSVSIDGDKIANDAYRGHGSWEDSVRAIALARENKIPVQLLVTITDLVEDRLRYITELADRHDCYIDFNFLSPIDEPTGFRARPEAASDEQMKKLLDFFFKKPNPRVVFSSYVLKYVKDWLLAVRAVRLSEDQIPLDFRPIRCSGGRFSAFIDANGDLWPCSLPRSDYRAVNVFDLGLEDAWKRMPENSCVACRSTGYCMLGAIYSLHPGSLIHLLRLILKGNYT